ncbi:MAG: LysM peptidoglycan-binding domain-containing protein [Bacteroidetes bacterium]|nr:MAG: LysM peptidoglycan-binding domain-containing protein [Bacteroidota bacterium]
MKSNIYKILKASVFCALMLSFSFTSLAQKKANPSPVDEDTYDPIIAALDSLVSLHYVQKVSESSETGYPESEFSGSEIPVYDNDIYAKRIQKIQTDIPLTFNAEVKEYLDLYALKRRSLTQRVMGLSELYFPLFEQILDEQGLPLEFKYLSIVESALNPTAVSRMGATGLWQFMLPTGRMYNLKVNTLIDERRDPVKATYAACEYFKDMYAIYDDWLLVIAAYNCGAGNVNRAIARSGGKKTFWEISPYLPRETRGYVPAFIAVTYLLNYSAEHNLTPIAPDLSYFETDTVMVDQKMSLRDIASTIDMPLEQLTYLNPVYKRGIIPDSEEPSMLRLPLAKINTYLSNVEQIYQKNELTTSPLFVTVSKPEASKVSYTSGQIKKRHHIRSGENLGTIANKYNCSVTDLKRWNNLHSSHLRAGNYLTVYVKGQKKSDEKTVSTKTVKSNTGTETKSTETTPSGSVTPAAPKTTSYSNTNDQNSRIVYHVVQPGDTLWDIAKRYDGVTVQQIKDVNQLNSNNLKVGTKLKVLING